MIYWLAAPPESPFPPLELALDDPNGLLAAGGDLHPARLLNAYSCGVFPWYGDDQPILWWAPDPRCILPVNQFHIARRLRRQLSHSMVHLSTDRAFEQVLDACADTPRATGEGTWIVPAMKQAYCQLHSMGYAHSIEVWHGNQLVGGLYGVLLGRMFFAESMFTRAQAGSKIALLCLCRVMARGGATFIDCQLSSPHLVRLGARDIPRSEFCRQLPQQLEATFTGGWPTQLPEVAQLLSPRDH